MLAPEQRIEHYLAYETILDTIAEISLDVDLRYDPNISLIVFSLDEYNQNSAWETPFIKNVRKEGIPL